MKKITLLLIVTFIQLSIFATENKVKNKTVVLTGAMIPIKFGSSDGLFNLGSALAFAQTLPAGVYVAMNGRYFQADNVRKNKQTGMFEEVQGWGRVVSQESLVVSRCFK